MTRPNHGTLCDYETGDSIRPATAEERAASVEAARYDGGAGVIEVDGLGVRCIDDRFDPHGYTYNDPDDFRSMCLACFGEAPELRETHEGYADAGGRLVLVRVDGRSCYVEG